MCLLFFSYKCTINTPVVEIKVQLILIYLQRLSFQKKNSHPEIMVSRNIIRGMKRVFIPLQDPSLRSSVLSACRTSDAPSQPCISGLINPLALCHHHWDVGTLQDNHADSLLWWYYANCEQEVATHQTHWWHAWMPECRKCFPWKVRDLLLWWNFLDCSGLELVKNITSKLKGKLQNLALPTTEKGA